MVFGLHKPNALCRHRPALNSHFGVVVSGVDWQIGKGSPETKHETNNCQNGGALRRIIISFCFFFDAGESAGYLWSNGYGSSENHSW